MDREPEEQKSNPQNNQNIQQKSADDYMCPICLNIMVEPIKLVQCTHYLCRRCLRGLDENNVNNKCPMCRQKIEIKDLINLKIDEKMQKEIKNSCLQEFMEQNQEEIRLKKIDESFKQVKFLYGNTHEVVEERKQNDPNINKWKCFIQLADGGDISKYIRKVDFLLHESFAQPLVQVGKPPFQVTRRGWGYFTIVIKIYWKQWLSIQKPTEIEHELCFTNGGAKKHYTLKYNALKVEEEKNKFLKSIPGYKGNLMNKKKEIILGYTKIIKKVRYDSESEEDDEFISKIGGQPVWMQKNQIPTEVLCKACGKQMRFMLQTNTCLNKPTQIRVFRCQFSKDFKLNNQAQIGNEKDIFEKEYRIITDIETKKEAEEYFWMAQSEIDSFALNDQQLQQIKKNQPKITEEDKEFEMAKQYAKQLIEQREAQEKDKNNSKSRKSSVVEEDSDDEQDMARKDKAFTVYDIFLGQLGPHVLRFCRDKNSLPLWFSDLNQWTDKDVGNCQHCGKKRIFEFQINNSLLNMYQELLVQDWGIAAIYSCENSCQVKDQEYVEELAMLQVGTEDPLTLKQIQQKIEEMRLEDEKWQNNEGEEGEGEEEEEKKDDYDQELNKQEGLSKEEFEKIQNSDKDQDKQASELSTQLTDTLESNSQSKQSNKQKNKKNKQKKAETKEETKQEEEEDDW
ncbi:hypothetical protein PPERSA_09549 [Pseudocohnilembus persalinus]|uniref:Uncharacterized protein n=1 Tax=Pseudocohnilembus persalinus TaxID=266149 RepID=A0A0V0QFG0_PSEPJ|nr:hypothetical protein PPERSA_09549 [Pseudocohnilembus persalinus]|eukprot:KRX00943.1 hypothetical protein PPERSA_09549 [Pseudocohnilembus persalinus]